MISIKGKPTIFLILYCIGGFLHVLIPAWGIIIPDIGASFYWYWGFYFAGGGGHTESGIYPDTTIVNAGTIAMYLMFIGFAILLISIILVRVLKVFETERFFSIFCIIWIITGILLLIAPSIYVYAVRDGIFGKYAWGIGVYFSYGLAIPPLLVGIVLLVLKITNRLPQT